MKELSHFIFKKELSRLYLLIFALLVCSCQEIPQRSLSTFSTSSLSSDVSKEDDFSLVSHDSDGIESYLGSLQFVDGQVEIPEAIHSIGFGDRRIDSLPVNFGLRVQVRTQKGRQTTSGQFYFEAPVYVPSLPLNTVTTALTWFIENRFVVSNSSLFLSRESWDKLIAAVGLYCQACPLKSSTEVIQKILSEAKLISEIERIVQSENSSMTSVEKPLELWKWKVGRSGSLKFENQFSIPKELNEGSSFEFETEIVHPASSKTPYPVSRWELFQGAALLEAKTGEIFQSTLGYETAGELLLSAKITSFQQNEISLFIKILSVNSNRPPTLSEIPDIQMQVNHETRYDLSSFIGDPDSGAQLEVQLLNAPSGMVTTGQEVVWNPLSAQVGTHLVSLEIEDQDSSKSEIQNFEVIVIPDQLPQFEGVLANYVFTEGDEGVLSLQTRDLDGDRLVLEILNADEFQTTLPANSGWNSSPQSEVGSFGNQFFQNFFRPSFLEVETQATLVRTLDLSLSYDPTVTGLRQIEPILLTVNIEITNFDDGPVWTGSPPNQSVTELIPFSFALPGGIVADSPLNPSAFTFSLSGLNPLCSYISIHPTTGQITGTPGYSSPATCQFTVMATDGSGLQTESSLATYSVANENRLPTISSAFPGPPFQANEGELFRLELKDYFSDQDDLDGDSRESLQFVCANCVGLGIDAQINPSGRFDWTPDFSHSGTYNGIVIEMTDQHMRTNSIAPLSQSFNLSVTDLPAPLLLTTAQSDFVLAEGAQGQFDLNLVGFSGAPIDSYDYDISLTCTGCPAGLVSIEAGDESGNGGTAQDSQINMNVTFDAVQSLTNDFKVYAFKLIATNRADSNIFSEKSFTLRATNTNRVPTGFDLTQDSVTSGTGVLSFSIDLNQNENRFKTFEIDLNLIDPDGEFDVFTYSIEPGNSGQTLGSISGSQWTYQPITCSTQGPDSFTREFKIRGQDRSGAFIERDVLVNFENTFDNSVCP